MRWDSADNSLKKVVVFGGGTGLSVLLSGLKLFPIDVTTIIAVSDNGSSTGILKNELDIPAVGDVGKVLLSMANTDSDFIELLGYRFDKGGTLSGHPIRNILLAALIDLKGDLAEATRYMCKLLNIKGTILPLTTERVDLIGDTGEKTYFGEEEVSSHIQCITRLSYDHEFPICAEIKEKIQEADLIILSPGSLYTSIIPHLLSSEIREAIGNAKAPIMYVANLVTQPGETEHYSLGDHIKTLNHYLENRKVDIALANRTAINQEIVFRYAETENKDIVTLDEDVVRQEGVSLITDDIMEIRDNKIRHNALKTAYQIFSYLMRN